MSVNKNLAIAIPTYNRATILKENIELMLEEIIQFSVPIYISDDSNNSETEILASELKKKYSNIFYSRNIPALGHDKNCVKTLRIPEEEYVWYLGDSIIIKKNALSRILEIINNSNCAYDFISVNIDSRVNIAERSFSDCNDLLIQLGWHITLSGATIYSKEALKYLDMLDLAKCRNFPQTAIILEQFAEGNKKLYWINDDLIYGNIRKKSYWMPKIFEVFLYDWDIFINNLPEKYEYENKKLTIKLHSEKTGLFTLKGFISYRAGGYYNWKVLRKYKKLIINNTKLNYCLLTIIAVFPKSILRVIRNIVKKLI